MARTRAQLDPGGVEIAVDGFRRHPQADGDLLAAIALDDIAEAIPLPIAQEGNFGSCRVTTFAHGSTLTPLARVAQPSARTYATIRPATYDPARGA